MKIFFIASGHSIHSKKWINYFAARGHRVFWLSFTPFTVGQVAGAKSLVVGKKDPITRYFAVKKAVTRFSPDVVHAHYAGVNGFFGMASGFHPLVLTAWGSDILVNQKSFWKRPILQLILKSADVITCDADHLKQTMTRLGVAASKIKIVRFGIDTAKFFPGPATKDIKNQLGITGPTVISLRSLEPIYDIESLIRAAPLIIRETPDISIIVAGKGSSEARLKRMAAELSVAARVKFIGSLPNDELPDYLRLADIYVSTSLSDAGIASGTAEAMACGLPVVVTDSGENRAWVKDNVNGFVVPKSSPVDLALKIVYLLKHNQEARLMGGRNVEVIKEKNDYFREMAKMEKIYENLVVQKTPGRA